MISVDDYFKENPEIEHAHSKTLWALLRFFSLYPQQTFGGQKEMVDVIMNFTRENGTATHSGKKIQYC